MFSIVGLMVIFWTWVGLKVWYNYFILKDKDTLKRFDEQGVFFKKGCGCDGKSKSL